MSFNLARGEKAIYRAAIDPKLLGGKESFALSIWVKATGRDKDNYTVILGHPDLFEFRWHATKRFALRLMLESGMVQSIVPVSAGMQLIPDSWNHLEWVYDG